MGRELTGRSAFRAGCVAVLIAFMAACPTLAQDLVIGKVADVGYAFPGSNLTYTIVITNVSGTVTHTAVTLIDSVPAGTLYVTGTVQVSVSPPFTTSVVYNSSDTFDVPSGVTNVVVEVWGGGGGGGKPSTAGNEAGGGGGGGGYARGSVAVSPGSNYTVTVGVGGGPGAGGGDSWFGSAATVLARGGVGGGSGSASGAGGSANIGNQATYNGGAGGAGEIDGPPNGRIGGGGGGSATSAGNGAAGQAGSAGGAGGGGEGTGGQGRSGTTHGDGGGAPGGGGGGGGNNGLGGAGADGRVIVTYPVAGTVNSPPTLANNWILVPGAVLTATFQVTVDDPCAEAEIINTATVDSDQQPDPVSVSITNIVGVGTPVALVFTSSTADLESGATRALTVAVRDAAGKTVTNDNGRTVTFVKTDGAGTVTGLGDADTVNGIATLTVTGALAGSISIRADDGALDAADTTFTVIPGTANRLVFTSSEADLAGGDGRNLTVEIHDVAGNRVTNDNGRTVTFSKTGGAGTVSGLGGADTVNGIATRQVTGGLIGTITIEAADGTLDPDTTTFTVVAGAAAQLVFTSSEADLASGVTRDVTVAVRDAAGNLVTNDNGRTVTFSKTGGAGTVSGLGNAETVNGIATLPVTGDLAGSITMEAVNGALDPDATTFTVVAGAAAQLVFTSSEAVLASGATRDLTVEVRDTAGNRVPTDNGRTVTFAKTGGAGTVSGLGNAETVNGIATLPVTGELEGSITIGGDDGELDPGSTTFTVLSGDAAVKLVFTSSETNLVSGATRHLTVEVHDALGNLVTNDTGRTVTFTKTDGAGTVSGLGDADTVNGIATLAVTGALAGAITIQAADGVLDLDTTTFTIVPGATDKLVFTSSMADLASGSTRELTVEVRDAAGNRVTNDTGRTVTFTKTDGAGTVSGLGNAETVNGIATLTVTGVLAGSIAIQAADGTLEPDTTGFNVIPGAAAALVFTSSATNLVSGSTRHLTVAVHDAAGNRVTNDTGRTVTFTKTGGAGTVTGLGNADTVNGIATLPVTGALAGTITIQAADGVLDPDTTTFTVLAGAATQLVFTSSETNLVSGSTRHLTVEIHDAAGNRVTHDNGRTVTFTKTGGAGTVSDLGDAETVNGIATRQVTGVLAGSITIRAADGVLDPDTTTFTVVAGAATQLVFTSSEAYLSSGAMRDLTVEVQDAAGNRVTTDNGRTVTFTKTDGVGTVTGLGNANTINGIATRQVTGAQAGSITIEAADGTLDPDTTTFHVVYLTITKTSDVVDYVCPDESITYTLVVSNISQVTHSGVTMSDAVPTGTIYVADSVAVSVTPLATTSVVYQANGSFTVPAGVTNLIVEVWGGGGGGGKATTGGNDAGGGGGGGGYARGLVAVTPDGVYTVTVGAGGDSGADGADSWFGSTTTVLAQGGGAGGAAGTVGAGGSANLGNQATFNGGAGGGGMDGGPPGDRRGGGGGGSATPTDHGGAGLAGATGGAGGSGVGTGGQGQTGATNGGGGGAPGGGGGGGGDNSVGGAGAGGRVIITHDLLGTPGDPPTLASDWVLLPGAVMTASFQVIVSDPLEQSEIVNTATVDSDQSALTSIATITNQVCSADLGIRKTRSDPLPDHPWHVVEFVVTVSNAGPHTAGGIEVTEYWPALMTFSNAAVSQGSYDGDAHIWTVGTMAVDQTATLWLTGVVDEATGDVNITNRVAITANRAFDPNPDNDADEVAVATRVVVARLDAGLVDGRLVIEWETVSEFRTAGFYLLRAGQPQGPWVAVNDDLLPARPGRPQGAVYRYADAGVRPGQTAWYRLREIEMSGTVHEYGPYQVHLPIGRSQAATGASDRDRFWTGDRASSVSQRLKQLTPPASPPAPATARRAVQRAVAATVTHWPALRLTVAQRGMIRVTATELAAALGEGISVADVRARMVDRTCGLSYQGVAIPVWTDPDGDWLTFYARPVLTTHADTDAYLLDWSPAATPTPFDAAPDGEPSTTLTFLETQRFKRDVIPIPSLATRSDADYWYWLQLMGGDPVGGVTEQILHLPGVEPGEAGRLRVALQGASNAGIPDEHWVGAAVNGRALGDLRWPGLQAAVLDVAIPAGTLVEGDNVLTLTAYRDDDVPYTFVFLQAVDVDYVRRYQAVDGQIEVPFDAHPVVTVRGFDQPDVRVLKVSDPVAVAQGTGAAVSGDPTSGWRIAYATPQGAVGDRHLAWQTGSGHAVTEITTVDRRVDLRRRDHVVQYALVAPEPLIEAAAEWAAYRETQGLCTLVVPLREIYDQFAHGRIDPAAIRDWLRYARTHWATGPDYLLLAGHGTYDERGRLDNDVSLVPTLMVPTTHGLTASDNAFGDLTGNGLPEVAVGRLPVRSTGEMRDLLAKVRAYEASPPGWWQRAFLFLSDRADNGGDFRRSNDRIMHRISEPPYNIDYADADEDGVALARDITRLLMKQGLAYVNYFGHGGLDRLSSAGLLTAADVPGFQNASRLPVVTMMSCVAADFAIPGWDALGEELVLSPDGGAVAVWGPTTLARNKLSETLATAFYDRVFDGETVLGRALLEACHEFGNTHASRQTVQTYVLLGDPALRLIGGQSDPQPYGPRLPRFSDWLEEHFSAAERADPAIAGPMADPDGDGLVNLVEYALGLNPRSADQPDIVRPESVAGSGGEATDLVLRFVRRRNLFDVRIGIDVADDLITWRDADRYTVRVEVGPGVNNDTETVSVYLQVPGTGLRRGFYRLRFHRDR